ncbi:MAG: patatin-like phospholipase family protein [Zoogloeaceae bacterium]|jgi:NTE family protein|nr:patatin-like phospholipase family protein [Zoogloeaceae bacterium]
MSIDSKTKEPSADKPRRINLGLQGGGAHGAYSWGVLDRLLEDESIEFDGVSGTSAGAINAVVLADGLMKGGREGARQALAEFWRGIADSVPLDLSISLPSFTGAGKTALLPATRIMLSWAQYLSPYQMNPLNFNPLRKLLKARLDFTGLRLYSPVSLFLAATNANTGKLRLFRTPEISEDAVLASACLPMLHQAIVIDGEPYWDGGYTANPPVFPLFYECEARDIFLVLLAPPVYGGTPKTAEEIRARAMELAFNNSLLREMQFFANIIAYSQARTKEESERHGWPTSLQRVLGRALRESDALEQHMLTTRFHLLESDDLLHRFGSATKIAADWPFLRRLRDIGYQEADRWLADHGGEIGQKSSLDLIQRFGV